MSTEIYSFSGTGNSLHVARELQKRIPDVKLIPIISLVNEETVATNGTTVGFVLPHYSSSLPKVVHMFIEKLSLGSATYLFAIVTRGRTGTMAFTEIDKILNHKGRRLDSFFAITMPSGSDPLLKGYASRITQERIRQLESEMLTRLDSIQRIVVNQEISREKDTGDETRQYALRDLWDIHPSQRILNHIAFLDRPVAESSDSPIIGMLGVSTLAAGKEGIDTLASERVTIQKWLQANPIESN